MKSYQKIIKDIPIPKVYRVKYNIPNEHLKDIQNEVVKQLQKSGVLNRIKKGMTIAIAVGSRGVAYQPLVCKTLIEQLKKLGANPFVIPAMGSHAGAEATGQKRMLEALGFTEEYLGVPIKSSMETIEIGRTEKNNYPVHVDVYANNADATIILNRIKAHTSFVGPIQSGLAKMAVIGLGKQKGAEICHELGFETMSARIVEIAHTLFEKSNIIFGIGLIENGLHQTHSVHVVPVEKMEEEEPILLEKANKLLARVPFKDLEVIVVDQIGKDISGTGLDPNVVGRYHTGFGSGGPNVTRISILDITDNSGRNANGIGISDFTTQRAYDKFDFEETYPNALTSGGAVSVKLPMVLPNDKNCIQASIKTSFIWDKTKVRLVRIKDTVTLGEMEVSETLLDEIKANPLLEIIKGPYDLKFDENDNLF